MKNICIDWHEATESVNWVPVVPLGTVVADTVDFIEMDKV